MDLSVVPGQHPPDDCPAQPEFGEQIHRGPPLGLGLRPAAGAAGEADILPLDTHAKAGQQSMCHHGSMGLQSTWVGPAPRAAPHTQTTRGGAAGEAGGQVPDAAQLWCSAASHSHLLSCARRDRPQRVTRAGMQDTCAAQHLMSCSSPRIGLRCPGSAGPEAVAAGEAGRDAGRLPREAGAPAAAPAAATGHAAERGSRAGCRCPRGQRRRQLGAYEPGNSATSNVWVGFQGARLLHAWRGLAVYRCLHVQQRGQLRKHASFGRCMVSSAAAWSRRGLSKGGCG